MNPNSILIIGAGPAGLSAAYQLVTRGYRPLLIERANLVGGLARTEEYKGYRFDIGGHRFYTKLGDVQHLWSQMLGSDFRKTARLSRIHYKGRFFAYPLQPLDALRNLGVGESMLVLFSYVKARLWPSPVEETFDQWVTNRFGERLYQAFFKTYTEKVWGIPCSELRADWAAQRIKGLSFYSVLKHALFGSSDAKSLITEFHYPTLGPGMMWNRFRDVVQDRGGQVDLGTSVVQIKHSDSRVTSVTIQRDHETREIATDHLISSMSLRDLILQMDPPPPDHVVAAAKNLHYRAFILVGLISNQSESFPDNWIYVHSPDVKVGRIQNYRNWSQALVPDTEKTSLGMEYFCSVGDEIWQMTDHELIALATQEIDTLGLVDSATVEDGVVYRQPKAYPVYDADYHENVQVIQRYLAEFSNLQTIGRNGTHHYNNMDHSMVSGALAVRNLVGESHDLWNVNTDQTYGEKVDEDQSVEREALALYES